ncbi:alpha-galactosidase [Clostridium sp. CTA-7]
MAIFYSDSKKIFHLQGKNTSYVLGVINDGYLVNLYWGAKVKEYNISNPIVFVDRGFSPNPTPFDRTFSLDTIPQEYPSYGNGDFRTPAFQVQLENGSTVMDLRYKSHKIYKGKPSLNGLPSTYPLNKDECETLEITLLDELTNLNVVLIYSVFNDFNVITRSVKFINKGKENLKLLKALSASIDFRDDEFELITLYGSHANEKNIARRKIVSGTQKVESLRGSSSAQQAPFLALVRKDTNEDRGEVFSFNFVYSGNFTAEVMLDPYYNTRVGMGINPFNFNWLLKENDEFQTPEVVMTYSSNGLLEMSKTYHEFYTTRLCRGKFKDKERPILINNWEATYFDFNEEKIKNIASIGKELGIELFVLDDGWFKGRNSDLTSLGDWIVDKEKLPNGLNSLAKYVNDLGMEFGLWFEPEMISEYSDLYKSHPDWYIHVPNRTPTISRNQLVLDLSRKEICDYLIKTVSKILSNANITYVKWDMNRNITDIWSPSLPYDMQGEVSHRYMLGLYYIMEKITSAFPNILFESCSGGGGRFDAGILHYMPQTWTSDNTDAICRLKIQYGTSLVYPPITMGSHLSASPNHQVGRVTPIETRGHVAMSGNFGYELDLTKLTEEQKNIIKSQISLYKEIRPIIQFGNFYRLLSPFEYNKTAWNFVSKDKKEMVGMYFKILSEPGAKIRTLKFKGLDENAKYQNLETKEIFGGDELMNVGISIPMEKRDFESMLWRFKRV